MISTRNAIFLVFVLSFVPFVFSIKCWDCQSNVDPHCGDPFSNVTIPITDCVKARPDLPDKRSIMCRKQLVRVNGNDVVVRGCVWVSEHSPACPRASDGPNGNIYCVICNNKDGCNGASAIGKKIALLLAPLSLLLFK